MNRASNQGPDRNQPAVGEVMARLQDALEGLRYGTISLTVHDGRVVQFDVTEKTRFTGRSPSA